MSTELAMVLIAAATGAITLIGASVALGWSMSRQFNENRKVFWSALADSTEKIIGKLEYHERHDDERFQSIKDDLALGLENVSNRIWNVELRNAAKDGVLPREYPIHRKNPPAG